MGADAVVVRRGTGPDAQRLRATGERLVAAAHPGVVEVVGSAGCDDEWELRLVHAGRPIDLVGPLSVEQVAGATAAVAAILADLHAVGIAHGQIDGSHVLIGSHGRPVLCGLGDPTTTAARPEDDVAALGALIVALLGTEAELEVIPERRWRRPGSGPGWARRSLLLVADQACAEPATRRPSARRLAAAIANAVPGAVAVTAPDAGAVEPDASLRAADVDELDPLDPLDAPRFALDDEPRRVRLPALIGAVVGVLVLGAGAVRLAQPSLRPVLRTSAPASAGAVSSGSSATHAASAALPPTTTTAARPPSVPCPDPTGTAPTGCGPIIIDGSTVLVGARRYEVGQVGDQIAVGDWDCDGIPTPALLRPTSGEVFVFPTWAGEDDLVVHATAEVPGGTELVTDDARDGCTTLAVRRADGSVQPIAAEALA